MDHGPAREHQQGQVMILFLLAIFAIIGMVGLVLDGGSVFAQRRDQQTAADLAAMAGAAAYLNATGTPPSASHTRKAWRHRSRTPTAMSRGRAASTSSSRCNAGSFFNEATVNLAKPHRNNFAAILGMPTWDVGVTATARSTFQANGARGAMPLLFNAEAFPGAVCNEAVVTCTPQVYQLPGSGNEDVPQDATQFNWTIFCTASGNPCNANSNDVRSLVEGAGANTVVYLDDDIGPLNAGRHTTLFDALAANAIGDLFPVPVVDDEGLMVGWAYFRLLSAEGGSDKVITGYFVSPVNGEELVVNGGHKSGELFTGAYSVRLTN